MSIELLLIAFFAVYRITLLVNKEPGPWDILGRFRTWAGIRYDEYSNPISTGQLSEGILCPYCLSVWVGIGITLFVFAATYFNIEKAAIYILLPFALSGVSVFLFKWAGV